MVYSSPVGTWLAPGSFDNAWNACNILIPGATTAEGMMENAGAVESTGEEMKVIEGTLRGSEVIGDCYHPVGMKIVNG